MELKRIAIVLGLVAAVLLATAGAQNPLGDWQYGRSTFYQGIDNGACGYGPQSSGSFPYRYIAAPNTAFYANAGACGECFEVQCLSSDYMANACYGGSVIIQVTDECPCQYNAQWCCGDRTHFDLSPEAFSRIANTVAGVINMQFRPVTCPAAGALQIKVKEGANQWWFAVLPINVGGNGQVTGVDISNGNNGVWQSMARQSYNYFVAEMGGNGFAFPVGIRVWQGGNLITGTIPYAGSGVVFNMPGNF